MVKYRVYFSKQAEKDKGNLKKAGLDKKAGFLLDIISDNPFQNPPPYEKLVGNLSGLYSRRINITHRIVYEVSSVPFFDGDIRYDGSVRVLRMWTHYDLYIL